MRGKDGRRQKRKPRVGITPAYAGKSLRGFAKVMALSDHPRICGEKRSGRRYHKLSLGSPPHMRGKVTKKLYGNDQKRDHPRICGEKQHTSADKALKAGSPPHMRGKAYSCADFAAHIGITPAYAGKSITKKSKKYKKRDHPRICGEKKVNFRQSHVFWGSPPHMRGKARHGRHGESRCGITPAYAGKRPLAIRAKFNMKDHPRICGEKYLRAVLGNPYQGSPPHMRGKGFLPDSCRFLPGITPAYAGKRKKGGLSSPLHGDHPRICGEKTKKIP